MADSITDFLSDAGSAYSSTTPATSGLGALSNTLGMYGMLAAPLIGGFTMPSGNEHHRLAEEARRRKIMEPIMEKLYSQVPEGMSYQDYIASRQSPETPQAYEQRMMYSGDEGDQGYEAEQINNFYQSPIGQTQNDAWLTQDDGRGGLNSDWYNPDMTRTDYSGPDAPPLSEQRQTAIGLFGSQNVRDPYTGLPTTAGGSQSLPPQAAQQAVESRGNIYGQDVPRQSFGGKDLYADQKLFSGNKYKGY